MDYIYDPNRTYNMGLSRTLVFVYKFALFKVKCYFYKLGKFGKLVFCNSDFFMIPINFI